MGKNLYGHALHTGAGNIAQYVVQNLQNAVNIEPVANK